MRIGIVKPLDVRTVRLGGGAATTMLGDQQRRRVNSTFAPRDGTSTELQGTDVLRRKDRHSGIFDAVRALDTQLDEAARHTLAKWIADQYSIEYGSMLLGMVAVCYLGPPYVDHRLDLLGGIVDHFAASDPMPAPYDSARMLARSGSYAFVEVHSDGSIVPVADDGTIL